VVLGRFPLLSYVLGSHAFGFCTGIQVGTEGVAVRVRRVGG
jgi:hypothetical protein